MKVYHIKTICLTKETLARMGNFQGSWRKIGRERAETTKVSLKPEGDFYRVVFGQNEDNWLLETGKPLRYCIFETVSWSLVEKTPMESFDYSGWQSTNYVHSAWSPILEEF